MGNVLFTFRIQNDKIVALHALFHNINWGMHNFNINKMLDTDRNPAQCGEIRTVFWTILFLLDAAMTSVRRAFAGDEYAIGTGGRISSNTRIHKT